MASGKARLERVKQAMRARPQAVALASDYDGTLAPIVEDPERARPSPEAVAALEEVSRVAGLTAVVSGRPVEFLRRMLGLGGIRYVGLYGLEGAIAVEDAWKEAVAEAARSAATALGAYPESFRLEDKGLALVVHYRRAPDPEWAHDHARAWAEKEASRLGLALLEGKFNIELVPPVRLGKGAALARLLAEAPTDLQAALFIGDDVGDLEAFEELAAWEAAEPGRVCLRVAVGSDELDPSLERSSDLVLESQSQVADFLFGLVRA